MKKFNLISFLKGDNAPIAGLLSMVAGLWFIYSKLYYALNPIESLGWFDLMMSIIISFGFAFGSTIVIIHSKNENTPLLFGSLDFVGYIIYYGTSFAAWWAASEYAKIAGGLFIPFLSACLIYNYGEIFIERVRQKIKDTSQASQVQTLFDSYKQVAQATEKELRDKIARLMEGQSNTSQDLNETQGQLSKEQEEKRALIQKLREQEERAKEFKEEVKPYLKGYHKKILVKNVNNAKTQGWDVDKHESVEQEFINSFPYAFEDLEVSGEDKMAQLTKELNGHKVESF